MSTEEFSLEFDILYNNIQSSQAPGLNALQKSILLTEAKEDVVKQLYSGNAGPYEITEEVTQYLRSLTKQADFTPSTTGGSQYNFTIPDDCWFITFEQAQVLAPDCTDSEFALVKAMSHNEFNKAMGNPFRKPDRRNVIRLTIGDTVQLYCDSDVTLQSYIMRYLAKPEKIYLDDFSSGNAPDEWLWSNSPYYDSGDATSYGWNSYKTNACPDLPLSLHRTILIRAVSLAQAIWS